MSKAYLFHSQNMNYQDQSREYRSYQVVLVEYSNTIRVKTLTDKFPLFGFSMYLRFQIAMNNIMFA